MRSIAIIAFVVVVGFSFAACGDGNGGGSDGGDDGIVISGTLSDGLGRGIRGARAVAPNSGQAFRAEVNSDNSITGKLQDGSFIYSLMGEYDPVTKAFSMQAPSSVIIFSIVGKLTAGNAIDTSVTSASIAVKESDEWTRYDFSVTPSNQTISGAVNTDTSSVTSIPVYWHGTFADQILGSALGRTYYIITINSITMYDRERPPQDLTVVEVTNADGSPADENGPWHFIIRAKWIASATVNYTGKFYVSKTFDTTLSTGIGSQPANDIFFGEGTLPPSSTISQAIAQLPAGIKGYVAPYVGTGGNVATTDIYPATGGYSPMFIGGSATYNAKAATTLKGISGFTLALK